MKHTIIFKGMRHGQKDKDQLTETGIQQVKATSSKNLNGLAINAAFASEKNRANQTMQIALETLGIVGMEIQKRKGFDYDDAPGLERTAEYQKTAAELANGGRVTIGHWKAVAPELIAFLAERVKKTLIEEAELLAQKYPYADVITALIGSHSPTIELAANDDTFPTLNETDIVEYTIIVERLGGPYEHDPLPQIISTRYIPSGF